MIAELSERIVRGEIAAAKSLGAFREGFRLFRFAYPELWVDVDSAKRERSFLLRFNLASYNADPPQVRIVNADGSDVALADHPLRNDGIFPSHPAAGLAQFLCIDGTRDYYTYVGHDPQTTGIGWEQQRGSRPLSALLLQISQKFASGDWS